MTDRQDLEAEEIVVGPEHSQPEQRPEPAVSGDHGDTAQELVELRRQLKEMNILHHREMDELRQKMGQPVNIQLAVPSSVRLKTFTGLPPQGGNECNLDTWVDQVDALLKDPTVKDIDPRLLSSLRGIAADAVKSCSSNKDIVSTLQSVFGTIHDPEELLLAFASERIKKNETPASFLSRLYEDLLKINKRAGLTQLDLQRKLFRTFCQGAEPSHPLLILELRNHFGFPGTAHPDFTVLLQTVRKLSEGVTARKSASTAVNVQAQQVTTEVSPDLVSRIVDEVTAKVTDIFTTSVMKGQLTNQGSTTPRNSRRVIPQGHCFNCGAWRDHVARDCPNPANPTKVAQAETRRRRWLDQRRDPLNE